MSQDRIFEEISRHLFGTTPRESPNNCVKCKKVFSPENIRTPAEEKERKLSGLCGICWDEIFKTMEEAPIAKTLAIKINKYIKHTEHKVDMLTRAACSPIMSKLQDFFEVHNIEPNVCSDSGLDNWAFTINEVQDMVFLNNLVELGAEQVMEARQTPGEIWFGVIIPLEISNVNAVIAVRVKDEKPKKPS